MTDQALARFRLDDAVVLLTGASSGLGERFAEVLDEAGARLVLAARRQERLDDVARRCRDALVAPCDMADEGSVRDLAATALDHYGRVDVLVNNAGVAGAAKAFDESMDDVREMVEVDFVSLYLLSQLVARSMRDRGDGGVIVNVASISALVGTGRLPLGGYSASKGAVISLTRELAAQWGRSGIRVNALAPGWFDAGMGAWVSDDDKAHEWISGQVPLGRIGHQGELDGALLFLASSASSYMTGQVVTIDGGWTSV